MEIKFCVSLSHPHSNPVMLCKCHQIAGLLLPKNIFGMRIALKKRGMRLTYIRYFDYDPVCSIYACCSTSSCFIHMNKKTYKIVVTCLWLTIMNMFCL